MGRRIVESFSMEEAFRALNTKSDKPVRKNIRESADVDIELVKAIEDQDVNIIVDKLAKYTKYRKSTLRDEVEFNIECFDADDLKESGMFDILSADYVICKLVPDLKEWWSILDGDGFGAAWNMLAVDTNNNVYGFFAETQGGPFIYGMSRVCTVGEEDEADVEYFKEVLEEEGLSNSKYSIAPISSNECGIEQNLVYSAHTYASKILGL